MTSTPVSGEVHRLRPIETAANDTDHTVQQQSQRVTGIAWRISHRTKSLHINRTKFTVRLLNSHGTRSVKIQITDHKNNGRKGTDGKH